MASLGTYIRFLRTTSGYSIDDLSKKLHVTKSTISQWESDKTCPSRTQFVALEGEFPTHREELRSLWLYSAKTDNDPWKILKGVALALWEKASDIRKRRYSNLRLTNEEAWINSRKSWAEDGFRETHHLLMVDYVSKLRELARLNSKLITVYGEYNPLLMSYLLGATDICPIEWRSICPKCESKDCVHQDIDCLHGIEKCQKCGHTFLSQLCMPTIDPLCFGSHFPLEIGIDVPRDFLRTACNLAVSYFSPVAEIYKRIYENNGEHYWEVIMLTGKNKDNPNSIEDIPTVDGSESERLTRYPKLVFHTEELNQRISDKLTESIWPELCNVYCESNIIKAASNIKKQLPSTLQADVDSVTTLNQLFNVQFLLRIINDDENGSIDPEEINELKKIMRIDNWTNLRLSKEEYCGCGVKDIILLPKQRNQKRTRTEDRFSLSLEEVVSRFHFSTQVKRIIEIGRDYSMGRESENLYRLLLESYFSI